MTQSRLLIWAAVSTKVQAEDEKQSISTQLADARTFAAANGLAVIGELVVPGHTRSVRTLSELQARSRAVGITAFDDLERLIRARAFDVFWCRGADRFARRQSLLHQIADMLIEDAGAAIYSQSDGLWVDESKTGKMRLVTWTPVLRQVIEEALARSSREEVFVTARGLAWSESALQSAMKRLAPGFAFRELRPKAASDAEHNVLGHAAGMLARYKRREKLRPVH